MQEIHMRILVHDRSGHPFQVQLSRELSRRGYQILHSYGAFFQTPKGALARKPTDPDNFEVAGIHLSHPFQKYSLLKRRFQEIEYARRLVRQIKEFQPGVVILANMPADALSVVYRECRGQEVKLVFWVQDLYGIAIKRILAKKLPLLGSVIGEYYIRLERQLLKQSDEVILITDDFVSLMNEWGIAEDKTHVVPNWAPLAEMPVRPKQNQWSTEHQIADKFCLLYAGTLGMKHNPNLLLQLALHFRTKPDVRILVISEGLGADWLRDKKQEYDLENLMLKGFQPFEQLPDAFAAADILIAILEAEAGRFSVPSKVLSYLCARRPLLLAVPPENLAARIVSKNEAGLVVHPASVEAFIDAADILVANSALRQEYANKALAYANDHFNIEGIGDKFERIIVRGSRRVHAVPRPAEQQMPAL
jgi:colanic acid biosynthesis glycosyl transferase WcaI